jgi:hypothetical protein
MTLRLRLQRRLELGAMVCTAAERAGPGGAPRGRQGFFLAARGGREAAWSADAPWRVRVPGALRVVGTEAVRHGVNAGADTVRRLGEAATETVRRNTQAVAESQRQLVQDATEQYQEV